MIMTSEWTTSRISGSIFCAIYCQKSDVMSNAVCEWSTLWFLIANEAYVWCKKLCYRKVPEISDTENFSVLIYLKFK